MQKILHIIATYKPAYVYGGPVMSVTALCEALQQNPGTGVHVYTTTANGEKELDVLPDTVLEVGGVAVIYFKRITKGHSHFSPALLRALWRNCKSFDIIHIHAWWNTVSVATVLICILRGVKPVLAPRGMLGSYTLQSGIKKIFHKTIGSWLLRHTWLHATSTAEQAELSGIQPADRIAVIPNFVGFPSNAVQKTRRSEGPLKLIFLGRIDPKKGLELLFSGLAEAGIPFELNIVGNGDTDYITVLQQKLAKLRISDSVVWTSPVFGDAKFELLAQADVLALTSYNENFANVVIEALYTGTPVLVSNKVGLAEYVNKNKFGWCCSLEIQDIAEKLKMIRTTVQPLTQQQVDEVKSDFTAPGLTEKYLSFYKSIQQ